MDNVSKLHEISLRIDQVESSGEWIARTLANSDVPASQAGSLICALAEDIRTKLLDLVTELEKQIVVNNRTLN